MVPSCRVGGAILNTGECYSIPSANATFLVGQKLRSDACLLARRIVIYNRLLVQRCSVFVNNAPIEAEQIRSVSVE